MNQEDNPENPAEPNPDEEDFYGHAIFNDKPDGFTDSAWYSFTHEEYESWENGEEAKMKERRNKFPDMSDEDWQDNVRVKTEKWRRSFEKAQTVEGVDFEEAWAEYQEEKIRKEGMKPARERS